MTLNHVTLDDKYDLAKEPRLRHRLPGDGAPALMQKERDRRAGLNTAGFVTGYRGSPLGGLDQQFMRAGARSSANDIVFQPGLNEDLAATAVWGSQQAELRGEGRFDGVFGIWYGKGPGVDRSGDVFRHANFAGTSQHGGVLALMGDDHTAESSTTAHQSEFHFVDVMIPILNPAGVQEILDYGLYGWAMSRYRRRVDGAQMHARDGRIDRRHRRQPRSREDRHSRRFPDAAGRPQYPPAATPCWAWKRGCTTTSATPCWPSCAPTSSTASSRRAGASRRSASSRSARAYLDVRQALDELGIDEVAVQRSRHSPLQGRAARGR